MARRRLGSKAMRDQGSDEATAKAHEASRVQKVTGFDLLMA